MCALHETYYQEALTDKLTLLENGLSGLMEETKELGHGLETRAWLLRIKPDTEWQLQIAAFAHDVERAISTHDTRYPPAPTRHAYPDYYAFKNAHAQRSAAVVEILMVNLDFEASDIARVTNAIRQHETGGDADSDLVRDADSIRWFAVGFPKYAAAFSFESAQEKGRWMYDRAAPVTKRLINELYADVVKLIYGHEAASPDQPGI